MAGDLRARPAQRGVAAVLALWLTVVSCFAVWIGAQLGVDRIRQTWPPAYPLLFLPNGRYLSAASLGFRVLLADVIYLWSIQYYGHHRTPEGRSYLRHIYNTITDLDPNFIDAYVIGALVMAQDMRDPQLAIELLDRGIERNPHEWRLPVEAGWYSYLNLKDYEEAERYYSQAAAIPGAPPWAARLRAHMIAEQGNLLAAMREWNIIRMEAEAQGDPQTVAIAEQHVGDLYSQHVIEAAGEAIERFLAEHGRRPESLAVLVRTGYLTDVLTDDGGNPINLREQPFRYDPATGEVIDPGAEQARTSR